MTMVDSHAFDGLTKRIDELEQVVSDYRQAEKMQRQNGGHWQSIVHHAVLGIYRVTHEGRFVLVNPKLAETFGYSSSENFLNSVSNIAELYLDPEDRPPILREMNEHGFVEGAHVRFRRKDGEIIWIRASAWVLREQTDEIVYEGFMVDITGQKQAEYLLRKSEERYRSLYQRTPVMLHSIDGSGRLLSVSRQWLEAFGYKRDAVIGRKITDFMTEASRRYAENEILPNFFKTGFVKDIPYRMSAKNGDIIDVLLSSTAERDDTGKIVRTLAVMIDVTEKRKAEEELAKYQEHLEELVQMRTVELEDANKELLLEIVERKRVEQALQESEARYRLLVENQNDLVVKIDTEFRLLFVSPSYCKTFGKMETDLLGKEFLTLIHKDDRENVRNSIRRVLDSPHTCYHEERVFTKDGWRWFSWSDKAVLDKDGNVSSIVAVGRDITESVHMRFALNKAQEELEKRVQQRTRELQETNKRLSEEILERKKTLDALRESETRYRGIVETQTELICRLLPDGCLTFVNKAICSKMGIAPEKILSQSFYQYLHPDDREKVRTRISNLSLENPIVEIEERVYLPDGEMYWWHWTNQAMFDPEGKLVEIQAIGRDITAVKMAEAKVRESDEHIRSLTDSATNFAIYRLLINGMDPLKMTTIFVSPSIEKIMGISDKADYEQWYESIHPEDLDKVRAANLKALKTSRFDEVFRIYNAGKGEWRWIHAVASGVEDQGGEVKYINGIFLDVTEQKRAETAFRDGEQRFRQLVETMGEGLAVQDEKGDLTYVNKSLCQMLGYTEMDLLGQPAIELFERRRRRRLSNQMTRQNRGQSGSYDINMIRKNGQFLPMMVSAQPVLDSVGGYRGSFAVLTDISKLKAAELTLKNREQELEIKTKNLEEVNTAVRVLLNQRNEDKEELEEKVLHNVKELVVPYLEKLEESHLDGRQASYIDILKSNLNDIVSPFSRSLSAKYMNLTPSEIHIANLLKQGKTTKEIADFLNISTRTVETHRKNIRKKLGLHSRKANLRTHLLAIQ